MRNLLVCFFVLLSACTGVPTDIQPVQDFDADRYLGKWYEIARLDHSFERGLEQVTAEYSLRDDGGIKVLNRGFDTKENAWDDAEGKAYFVGDRTSGHLKVSFFGPFYGSYIVFDLGDNYDYSLVTSSKKSYLWLLARTPTIDAKLQADLLKRMKEKGFDTEALIFVKHDAL